MTGKFDLLVECARFLELTEGELLGLLDEPALNLDVMEERHVVEAWLVVGLLLDCIKFKVCIIFKFL